MSGSEGEHRHDVGPCLCKGLRFQRSLRGLVALASVTCFVWFEAREAGYLLSNLDPEILSAPLPTCLELGNTLIDFFIGLVAISFDHIACRAFDIPFVRLHMTMLL